MSYGGSLSGEHGDGQSRGALLPKMFGPELMKAFGEFKSAWDPGQQDESAQGGRTPICRRKICGWARTTSRSSRKLIFNFPTTTARSRRPRVRCIGLGACRKQDSGSMCPSYMVTLEEEHSTRGRAHMLFEMLQGEVVRDGWKDEHVKKALDLCLSCKACKSECPANVDIATYKAEFLSHYYEGKRRPLHAYAFGMIDRWARLASLAPGLANLLQPRARLASADAQCSCTWRRSGELPRLAAAQFPAAGREAGTNSACAGADDRTKRRRGRAEVILWADTFNNYFHPETSRAALEVLDDAGFQRERSAGASVLRPAAVRFRHAR